MPKLLVNTYPNLKQMMERNYHCVKTLTDLLGISADSVRRRLKGDVDFELKEVIILSKFYGISIEELFLTREGND